MLRKTGMDLRGFVKCVDLGGFHLDAVRETSGAEECRI
jgi:hypothetical protein